MAPPSFAAIGALYPAERRGLTSDLLAAHALKAHAYPVCTAFAIAGHGRVTDLTEVPEDTVRAQLEHLADTTPPSALKIGVMASHGAVVAVLDTVLSWGVPSVLDLTISGSYGETVLSRRGLDALMSRLEAPDLVMVRATDAELVSGGEIQTLDDAQVAAQRIVKLGARAILIKCGPLRSRHFEQGPGNGADLPYASDLFYDGQGFSLFEAPFIAGAPRIGASSAHAAALICALLAGETMENALQSAKGYVTEAIRRSRLVGGMPSLSYFWQNEAMG